MKENISNLVDMLTDRLQESSWGISLISMLFGAFSRMLNQNKVAIQNHQGYWFRHHSGIATPMGRRLRLRRNIIRSWTSLGETDFEMRARWWFRSYSPQEGDCIVDVGAGMGEDAHVFSKAVGAAGSVLAIEAHPATCKALSLFVDLNNITNVEINNIAVSDTDGILWMSSLPDDDWQCNSIATYEKSKNDIKITAMRLDDVPFLSNKDTINFMKMNIEGAEVLALNGAWRTLTKTKNLCVCCHDFLSANTQTKDDVCKILTAAGFTISFADPDAPPYERDFVYGSK
jgi:FkbM family methyltransferase